MVTADDVLDHLLPEDWREHDDLLTDTQTVPLHHAEAYDGGQHRFEGEVRLTRTGAFGYTVRVLPKHAGLASSAELGLVTNAS